MMKLEKTLIDVQDEVNKLLNTYGQDDNFTKIQVRLIRANTQMMLKALRAADKMRVKMHNIQKCACNKFQKTK